MNIDYSPEFAEICGIHAGDGYLRGKDHRNELDISGNLEEKEYYENNLSALFRKVFDIEIICKHFPSRNTYGFVVRDKNIVEILHDAGFPYGNKSTIVKIPEFVLNSEDSEIHASFLRGLFDTDGCVHFWKRNKGKYGEFKKNHHYYPIIKFTTVSIKLSEGIKTLLEKMGFQKIGYYIYTPKKQKENKKYTLTLYGPEKVEKFFNIIAPKNPVKISRYLLWKKLGHCPPYSTYKERLETLKNTN